MDKIKKYQDIIISFLEEYAKIPYANSPNVEKQVIADVKRNHFQLVRIGWESKTFKHETVFHIDIKNDKVWIQQNWTDIEIADEFLASGIPSTDIVLGFQPPYARTHSGFAVA